MICLCGLSSGSGIGVRIPIHVLWCVANSNTADAINTVEIQVIFPFNFMDKLSSIYCTVYINKNPLSKVLFCFKFQRNTFCHEPGTDKNRQISNTSKYKQERYWVLKINFWKFWSTLGRALKLFWLFLQKKIIIGSICW
jgi:hypothetical protein